VLRGAIEVQPDGLAEKLAEEGRQRKSVEHIRPNKLSLWAVTDLWSVSVHRGDRVAEAPLKTSDISH